MYMVCTWNGIEFVFNNQTGLILLLLVKQFVRLICCHLTEYCSALKYIKSLVNGHAHEPILTHLDVSPTLCSFLGFILGLKHES